jgi:hypothetical protein
LRIKRRSIVDMRTRKKESTFWSPESPSIIEAAQNVSVATPWILPKINEILLYGKSQAKKNITQRKESQK